MTAQELIQYQIQTGHRQVRNSVKGLDDAALQNKLTLGSMSIASMLEHLCECRVAFIAESSGEKHNWGNYSAPDSSAAGLLGELSRLTEHVIGLVQADPSDENMHHATDFVALHDAYHVGQICACRMTFDPEFDPYSIYQGEDS